MISVAVPVAIDRPFSYAVPAGWPTPPVGARVLVPLGRRVIVGVVRRHEPQAPPFELRPIVDVLDPSRPSVSADLVELCEWMSDYYVAPIGEVYRLALPGLLVSADARTVALTEAGRAALNGVLFGATDTLDERAHRILRALAEGPAKGSSATALVRLRPRIPGALVVLDSLIENELCEATWSDGTHERFERFYRRTDLLRDGAAQAQLQALLGRSKKRRALLEELESRPGEQDGGWVAHSELRGQFPRLGALVSPLVDHGLVATAERPKSADPFGGAAPERTLPQPPTAEQAAALAELHERARRGFSVALLHGVTGSGKTEVYLQLIAALREQGKGAIVLVPEIALTPQLSDRFRARFGDEVAVLHSGLSQQRRLEAWNHIRAGRFSIVIGARSAIFAPLENVGAIIVDEEHDPSFKQEDGVRYNARDVALMRARSHGAIVVLGSATPSLETYAHALSGRYAWLRLTQRPTARPLPTVDIVSLRVHRPSTESGMTAVLRDALERTVAAGEQAILFLNRRGFAPTSMCVDCGAFQQCPDCSAPSMTYHLGRNRLVCHLCAHVEPVRERCSQCGSAELVHGGVGTERVELTLAAEFPRLRFLRLDRDAARGNRLLETLERFRRGEADVLVGTQMLSKGHDFPNVTLVGVLQGDHGLALPDPRAAERTFALLTQVAGRAGRGTRAGRVVIQAFAVHHPVIVAAQTHDYEAFAREELAARQRLGNPPFGYLALLRVHGSDDSAVSTRIGELAERLQAGALEVATKHPDEPEIVRLLGPVPAPIARINQQTRWQLLVRAKARAPLRYLLAGIRPLLGASSKAGLQTLAFVDVDPHSLL